MNIIMTTSGYILRLRDLISNKISNMLNFNHSGLALAEVNESGLTAEAALHMLLDQGRSFHDAELIVSTINEWGLPLENISLMEFEVHGNSVWIKPD